MLKAKAYYRILPDGTIWLTEYDGTGRNLAEWKTHYDHSENIPIDGTFGTCWNIITKESFKFSTLKEWVKKLHELYDIDTTKYKAESWTSGMWHNGILREELYLNCNN